MQRSAPKQFEYWAELGKAIDGAGKSTFYKTCLAPREITFVNADQIARHVAPAAAEQTSYAAARIAE